MQDFLLQITLDQKLKGLQNIDLIKVDVECHELEVLQGAMLLKEINSYCN